MKSEKLKVKKPVTWWLFHRLLSYTALGFSLFTLHFALSTAVSAQDDQPELAPPPVKIVSKDERARLDAETDLKSRTKLALDLMDAHLVSAEKLNTGEDYDRMFGELGTFHGLVDNSLDFLAKQDTRKNKVLDNFKRLEMGFRGFMTRLEVIHRNLPLRYEEYVRKLIKYIRDARTKAIEPMFGNSVVPGQKPDQQ